MRDLGEETILRRMGVFVERGKFNGILGVNALLPYIHPVSFKQASTNISLSVAEREWKINLVIPVIF